MYCYLILSVVASQSITSAMCGNIPCPQAITPGSPEMCEGGQCPPPGILVNANDVSSTTTSCPIGSTSIAGSCDRDPCQSGGSGPSMTNLEESFHHGKPTELDKYITSLNDYEFYSMKGEKPIPDRSCSNYNGFCCSKGVKRQLRDCKRKGSCCRKCTLSGMPGEMPI